MHFIQRCLERTFIGGDGEREVEKVGGVCELRLHC